MVAFLGDQHLMSSAGLGVFVYDHTEVVLADGSVVLAYFSSSTGPLHFYRYDPDTGATTHLSSMGAIGSGYDTPRLMARADGGFTLIMKTEVGFLTEDDRITKFEFDANATQQSSLELAAGFLEMHDAVATDAGFFVAYRDRRHSDGVEYKGRFIDAAGNELATVDFNAGNISFNRAVPDAVVLANGNVAVVWNLSDVQGTRLQIFQPNGTPVTAALDVTQSSPSGLLSNPPVIAVNPEGGFVILSYQGTDQNAIHIQKFTDAGAKKGAEIILDATVDAPFPYAGEPKIGFTASGLMVVGWTTDGTSTDNKNDVYISVLTQSGQLIAGPLMAGENILDDQKEVGFTQLNDGRLLFSFFDDTNVWLSHQASIQARLFEDPDWIWEGNGRDNTRGGTAGNDVMLGLAGDDTLNGRGGEDYLKGGRGNDALKGGGRADILEGELGDDQLIGGAGNDQLIGGYGNDTLGGGGGADQLFGGDGADLLIGGAGADILQAGRGNDGLRGGNGDDVMSAESGRNNFQGGDGNDTMTGGSGRDRMLGQNGNDVIDGGEGPDKLIGGAGNDILRGGDGNDVLQGEDDNDFLNGGAGNDREYGGAGNDTFYDSDGNDRWWGGAGSDTFRFLDTDFGNDRIKDFEFGVDVLDMSTTARALEFAGMDPILVTEVRAGVRFEVNADHWVLVEGATLADFGPNDLILS